MGVEAVKFEKVENHSYLPTVCYLRCLASLVPSPPSPQRTWQASSTPYLAPQHLPPGKKSRPPGLGLGARDSVPGIPILVFGKQVENYSQAQDA